MLGPSPGGLVLPPKGNPGSAPAKYVLRIRCAFLTSVLCSLFITFVLNTDYFLIKCMWDKRSEQL